MDTEKNNEKTSQLKITVLLFFNAFLFIKSYETDKSVAGQIVLILNLHKNEIGLSNIVKEGRFLALFPVAG